MRHGSFAYGRDRQEYFKNSPQAEINDQKRLSANQAPNIIESEAGERSSKSTNSYQS